MNAKVGKTGYIRHFEACNQYDRARFAPFYIGPKKLGWVAKALARKLPKELDVFEVFEDGIALAKHLTNFKTRSEALAEAVAYLAKKNEVALRREMYPVLSNWGEEPLAQIDRTAVPWFGVRAFGIHVNGFVRRQDGIYLWVGERAGNRMADPGKYDNMIGGGQPIGLSVKENLRKEADEEAGIGPELINTAKQVRTLGYVCERQGGLRNDTLFVYDLEMPKNFVPQNTDGEVAAFHLMNLKDVADIVRSTDRFKFNCNLVVIDFLVRHEFIAKTDREYKGIMSYLAPEKPPHMVLMSSSD
jgi:isopentenyldiphosphate isomerase